MCTCTKGRVAAGTGDDPASKTARARGLARRMQEAECLLVSPTNKLDSEGRAYTNRPQQPHVTDKSAHTPTLPEVQGFSDGGQLSHSLHADRVGFLGLIDKQMQNLCNTLDLKSTLSSVVTSSLISDVRTMNSNRCKICSAIRFHICVL